jgi:integrase
VAEKNMRQANRLSAVGIGKLKTPGMYADGDGLWLQVKAYDTQGGRGLAKTWIFRYERGGYQGKPGRVRHMGLGSARNVSLKLARERAADARNELYSGADPIDARNTKRDKARAQEAKRLSFKQATERYVEQHKAKWSSEKHAGEWFASLQKYAFPKIGNLSVADIDVTAVLSVIRPEWNSKTETMSRVRGRIERVLAWAKVCGYRSDDNPAAWSDLKEALPSPAKVKTIEHFASMPYEQLAPFMAKLREIEFVPAKALEFAILTAARTNEVLGARWAEVDLDAATWTIPASRMKNRQSHRVPLSKSAAALLMALPREGEYIFPGAREGKPLWVNALRILLQDITGSSFTTHGFRATFRMWAAERTSRPRDVVELCLAHNTKSKTEAAYDRSDLFEKRRQLLEEWSRFCSAPAIDATVTPIRAAR